MLRDDVAKVIDNLIVELLRSRPPIFSTGEFVYGIAQALHFEEFGLPMQVGMDLIAQGAEEHHLQPFPRLMGEVM